MGCCDYANHTITTIARTSNSRKASLKKRAIEERRKCAIAKQIFHNNQRGNQRGKRRIFKTITVVLGNT